MSWTTNERGKLGAVVALAKPEGAGQICRLVENLDLFEFVPGVHTPVEYGKFMIQESGRFEYDPNLEEFYDFEGYGLQRMDHEDGSFTDRGYVAYLGAVDLKELMAENPVEAHLRDQGFQMGGLT